MKMLVIICFRKRYPTNASMLVEMLEGKHGHVQKLKKDTYQINTLETRDAWSKDDFTVV